MALGDLTKQLAEQAIAGTIRSSTQPKSDPSATPQPEDVAATIAGEVQAMQKALKEEDELLVQYHTGAEMVRVLEVFLRSRGVVVLTGHDAAKNITRVVAAAESLRLTCKVVKAQPGAKPVRVNFIRPKS